MLPSVYTYNNTQVLESAIERRRPRPVQCSTCGETWLSGRSTYHRGSVFCRIQWPLGSSWGNAIPCARRSSPETSLRDRRHCPTTYGVSCGHDSRRIGFPALSSSRRRPALVSVATEPWMTCATTDGAYPLIYLWEGMNNRKSNIFHLPIAAQKHRMWTKPIVRALTGDTMQW